MRNIVDIFSKLNQFRSDITEKIKLYKTPGAYNSIVPYDSVCMYKLGEPKRESFLYRMSKREGPSAIFKSKHKCLYCELFSILFEANVEISKPFSIRSLSQSYKFDVITGVIPVVKVISYNTSCEETHDRIVCITKERPALNDVELTYLESDAFTNDVLIHWIISMLVKIDGFHIVDNYIAAFICENTGFIFKEYIPEIKLREIDVFSCGGVMTQIFLLVGILSRYGFTPGKITTESVKIYLRPIDYSYEGKKILSPYRCVLSDFSTAAINYEGSRICAHRNLITPNDITITESSLHTSRDIIRLFKYEGNITFNYSRLAKYMEAVNAYIYMILLYNENNMRSFIQQNPEYLQMWRGLWLNTEINDIESRIINMGSTTEYKVLKLLQGINLRLDAMTYIWDILIKNNEDV